MPSLGADMDEGTIVEWLVAPGDIVHKGDIVAVVDTAKAAIEVETFVDGTIEQILVEPGNRVPVGAPLARIATDGNASAAPPKATTAPSAAAAPEPVPEVTDAKPRATPPVRRHAADLGVDLSRVVGTGKRGQITRADIDRAAHQISPQPRVLPEPEPRPSHPASPYARRLASELGVDLATVTGTGKDHAIRASDVRAAATRTPTRPSAPTPAPVATAESRQEAMRTSIARLMARSNREIPHYYLSTTVDMFAALGWLEQRNRELAMTERLVPAALLLKATALAVKQRPDLNGFWIDDSFVPSESVNLGVAISLRGGGLVTPALHDADQLPVVDLMRRLKDLVGRARSGRLQRTELVDPSITVTNLGDQGVERVYGVIYPPQVALVGIGRVVERPWSVGGLVGARPCVTVTLAADHRATDGFTGARLLDAIDRLLQTPEAL
ncbi:MAG: dihydrolipoamide acetyltransferase family protein [Nocardioidaceae bacterium]